MSTHRPPGSAGAPRHLPVRPDVVQLRHQAKDLLRAVRRGEPEAVAELTAHGVRPEDARLADAQRVLARSYGVASWPRLVRACALVDAICRDDADAVEQLVLRFPALLHEDARGVRGNWGPPMSYAANLGRDGIIARLHALGATDVQFAFDRAVLQGQIGTARRLYAMGGRPTLDTLLGAAETHDAAGFAFALEHGVPIDPRPVEMLLQTYCRRPEAKHQCLELLAAGGIALPDTPPMAVHRGRLDLLERHLREDPGLVTRTFPHEAIFPPEVGCSADHSLALHGTPVAGGTLLHLCVDTDDIAIAAWLLDRGADPDSPADVDRDGFGGRTALYGCVVSQPYRVRRRTDDGFARLLLDRGASPTWTASLRKRLRFTDDETLHTYPGVTPLSWGARFHDPAWVNPAAMELISERGGS